MAKAKKAVKADVNTGSKRMGEYELMLVLKPLLPDEVRKAIDNAVVKAIQNLGGSVIETDVWGKRYLAYPIASHKEGYYILYSVNIPTEEVKELERQLRLKQEILRFLVVKRDRFSKATQSSNEPIES